MVQNQIYVPILKWKRGEQKALEKLDSGVKSKVMPLIEISPIPYDFANERYSKSIDDHLSGVAEQIERSWGSNLPLFIDLNWIDSSERLANGRHPLAFITEQSREAGLSLIPVVGFNRDEDYIQEVRSAYQEDGLGVCIRLEDEDLLEIDERINELLTTIDIEPRFVDLVLDFKYISPNDHKRNLVSLLGIMNQIPHINAWRSLVFCASSFPENLSEVSAESTVPLQRAEWLLWKELHKKRDRLERVPMYGDYAIANPTISAIDPRLMRMSANLRYTSTNDFVISKGQSIKKGGFEQMQGICLEQVHSSNYAGETFSWGDQYIFKCAEGEESTGNAETWRRVGTNHHITFVVDQLSNYYDS